MIFLQMLLYRAFLRRLLVENTAVANAYTGLAWLFFGVMNSESVIYEDLWRELSEKYGRDRFRADFALSREQVNKSGAEDVNLGCTVVIMLVLSKCWYGVLF